MTLILALITQSHAITIDDFIVKMKESWRTAPSSFSTSYSPCLDALILNYRAAGCKVIAQDPEKLGDGSVGLVCTMPEVSNGWTTNEHVIFYTRTHEVTDFRGWDVFCVDPNVTMYIPEPNKAK